MVPRGKYPELNSLQSYASMSFFFKPCEYFLPKSVIRETLFILLQLVDLPFLTEQDGRTLQTPLTVTQVAIQTTELPQCLKTKTFIAEYIHR